MGDYLQIDNAKSPWETTFKQSCLNPQPSGFQTQFSDKWKKTHHMHLPYSFQDPRTTRSAPNTEKFIKSDSFQDPRFYVLNRLQ